VSNGVLLNESKSDLLLHPILRQVNFSIHSFHDNFPDRDPTDYLNRIFNFIESAFEKRPDLYLNLRLWNLEAPNSSRNSNELFLSSIESRFGVKIARELDVRKQKSHRLLNRLYLHYDTEFTWPDPSLPLIGEKGTCYGLRNHFGILVDGTVVPCCLDKEGRIPLGNIEQQSILEILESERAVRILDGFLNRKLTESLCQRCNYVTRF
jgi:radical SAM protein with 4Fe4S-binding SPASM domain